MPTKEHQIRIERLGTSGQGYRILASRTRPPDLASTDAWIFELAPSNALRRRSCSCQAFRKAYEKELETAACQNILKPLALLSRRKTLVLLCDCADGERCYHEALSQALKNCRDKGDFRLEF